MYYAYATITSNNRFLLMLREFKNDQLLLKKRDPQRISMWRI